VNETIGPIFFRHALSASGEIVERRGTGAAQKVKEPAGVTG
jgi:hypothetical protein